MLLAQAVKTHRVKALENVAVFPMLGNAPMLLDETLNILKAGDDPLFARRAASLPLGFDLDAKLL
jgi:hypothetical protein